MNKDKRNLTLMCVKTFLQGLVFYGCIATVIRQNRGLDLYEIFILESVLITCMILFEIPRGYFADKFGYKKNFTVSYFLFLMSKIIFYNCYSFFYI